MNPDEIRQLVDAGEPACFDDCAETLREMYAMNGIDAHVTAVAPLVPPRYEPLGMKCPHGVLWFAEPTGWQIARWAEDGTE